MIIPTHLPPEVKFQVTISKLRKRNKISLLLVYVLHKISHFHVIVVQKMGMKCTRRCDACSKLLFCLLNLLFFSDVLIAVRIVRF